MRDSSKKPAKPHVKTRPKREVQDASAKTALEPKSDDREPKHNAAIKAARDFARSIAGENKVRFIHAFQIALDVAESALRAKPEESNIFDKVKGHNLHLLSEKFYSDPTFVENAVKLIDSMEVLGGILDYDFPDCVAVGPGPSAGSSEKWTCSGTLIAPNAVLTSRHGVSNPCYVYVGSDTNVPKQPYKVYAARSYKPHYDKHDHDLAILFLEENVEQKDGVRWRPRASADMIKAATSIVAVGYGSNEPEGMDGSGYRRKAPLAIKSRLCTSNDHQRYSCYVGLEMLANGVDGRQNSCKGDSGGPAYIYYAADNNWYLAGVTSRPMVEDIPCGGHIYVRVDKYEGWIDKQLKTPPPVS